MLDAKYKQNYRANRDDSVKIQEKQVNSKCMQNYRANRDESVKTQEEDFD